MSGAASRAEIRRVRAAEGEYVDMASLLFVDNEPDATRYVLERTAKGWRVTDSETDRTVGIAIENGKTRSFFPRPRRPRPRRRPNLCRSRYIPRK